MLIVGLLIAVVLGVVAGVGALVDAMRESEAIRRLRVPLIVAAAAGVALWLGAVATVRIRRQPLTPRAGPATAELRPEPPAVANMLVNDFRVTRDALPATLLDLAARRIVEIDGSGGSYEVRLRRAEPEGLTPYEARVHGLLGGKVVAGVVPAEALTTGPTEPARSWWRGFRGEVVADAKARGLSEDLWNGGVLRLLGILAVVPAALVALASLHEAPGIVFFVAAVTGLSAAKGGGRQRHTEAGLRAVAGWLGARRYLRDGAFADLPPTAVAVWERYLSYAAALGVAAGAVRPLPMGADDDRRAWTAASGQWRQVRVRYPRLLPPGWGMNPWAAAVVGVALVGMASLFLSVTLRLGWTDPELGPFRLLGLLFVGIPLLFAVGGVVMFVLAIGDLRAPREMTGLVLRRRTFKGGENNKPRHYLALDDGSSAVIRAWRLRPQVYRTPGVAEYRPATASVTPNLGYVRWVRPAERPGDAPGPGRRSRP
ncbi:MAG: DUF2207 family protein [Actinomycetota bacterium]